MYLMQLLTYLTDGVTYTGMDGLTIGYGEGMLKCNKY